MKAKFSAVLIIFLFLNSCSTASATPSAKADVTAPPSTAEKSTATEISRTETATKEAAPRQAVLSEVENKVFARTTESNSFIPASSGMAITSNGGIETGNDGRARLDLLPDGTIVRVGPNSSFTMPELTEVNGKPSTTLNLLFGKVYILLNGGSLTVKTPTGTASVQGSVLSAEYDPETGDLTASCLEGHCSLEDEEGNEVELTDGESSYINDDAPPSEPESMDSEEIQEWLDEVPEMPEFFDEMPAPEDFPEPESTSEPGTIGEPDATGEPDLSGDTEDTSGSVIEDSGGTVDDGSGGGGDTSGGGGGDTSGGGGGDGGGGGGDGGGEAP